jgi:hypothetical protein
LVLEVPRTMPKSQISNPAAWSARPRAASWTLPLPSTVREPVRDVYTRPHAYLGGGPQGVGREPYTMGCRSHSKTPQALAPATTAPTGPTHPSSAATSTVLEATGGAASPEDAAGAGALPLAPPPPPEPTSSPFPPPAFAVATTLPALPFGPEGGLAVPHISQADVWAALSKVQAGQGQVAPGAPTGSSCHTSTDISFALNLSWWRCWQSGGDARTSINGARDGVW